MLVVWDEPKRARNLLAPPEGHALDFADARDRFEWDTAMVLPAKPSRRGEPRHMALGFLDGQLVALVFAYLGTEAISAISLRRASNRESIGPKGGHRLSEKADAAQEPSASSWIRYPGRCARGGTMPSDTERKAEPPRTVEMLSDEEEAALQAEIAADPDAMEATAEDLAQMRPAREAMPPALYEALTRRGRPRSPNKLVQVTLRLDPTALASFRATGPGWQGRINEAVIAGSRRLPKPPAAEEADAPTLQARRGTRERATKSRGKA